MKLVFKAEQFPTNLIVIAAVVRVGKHSENRHCPDNLEKRALFNFLESFGLLFAGKAGKGHGFTKAFSDSLI